MDLVAVKEEPQELVELGDSDDNDDNARGMDFGIDEEENRSMIAVLRRKRNRRNASLNTHNQPRLGPLANSSSPQRFGTPTNSQLMICEDEDADAEPVQTKSDLVHVVLTAVELARLRKYLCFEKFYELVAGNAYVRLLSGAQKKIDQIVGILCCDEPYECDLLGTNFDMRFQTLWSGVCRLTQIAAQPAEEMAESEFERWKQEIQKRRLKPPMLEFVAEKSAAFSAALALIAHEHSADEDFPSLRVQLDGQDEDLMPAGCFSETDEETDETEEQKRQNSSSDCATPTVPPSCSAASVGYQRTKHNHPPQLTPTAQQTVSDPVETAADVKDALLTRERLITLYTSNSFDQFGRAVTGCFVRVNTGQIGYKLDQLEMVSETAMEPYTLKAERKCRVILHLALHGRRRINTVAFTTFKGTTQADTEFRDWHALMAEKRVPLPSKRFVGSKVAQLAAFSAAKDSLSSSDSAHKQPQQHHNPASTAALAGTDEAADKEQHRNENGEQNDDDEDDVQLVNDEPKFQLTPESLRSITLTTQDLLDICEGYPSIEKRREVIAGCFVRVFDHTTVDGISVHRLHQIVNVQKGVHYRLRTAYVDMHLTLRGESEPLRCDNVSGKPFTVDEFEDWVQRTQEKEFPPPTELFIAQKMERLGRSKADPSSASAAPTEANAQNPKTKQRKRSWMAMFWKDSGGKGSGEKTPKRVDERSNRTATTTPSRMPRTSSFSNSQTTAYGQRRHHTERPAPLFPAKQPAFYYSSPVPSTIRHQKQQQQFAITPTGNNKNDDNWARRTERFITQSGGIVDPLSSSSSRAYRPYRSAGVAGDGHERFMTRHTFEEETWRRTSAPMEQSKQKGLDMDEYVGHRPLSCMSVMEWSDDRRTSNNEMGGYGSAPRAITSSPLQTNALGATSNSGVGALFPSSRYPSPAILTPTHNTSNSAAISAGSVWVSRPWQSFANGESSDEEEPMVARARRQVMNSMEPIGDGGGATTGLPWHGLQWQQQQQTRNASPAVVQQETDNFRQFEQRWYSSKSSTDGGDTRREPLRTNQNYDRMPRSFKQFEQNWYNKDGVQSTHHYYSTPHSRAVPPRQRQFFSAPSPRRRRNSLSPPRKTPGVPSSFFFSAKHN